ncbi:peroxisomal multifunctional enzyme type 2-like [Helicoverpa zea]|uniref:peroxisomal multifunctional enzyme type 2-like n=1 Tax=Helicoverpa zea TaxID=7113 RepID=UPI001F56E8C8|nr:peroxisomal multifunctional enzyme type 2-like [Helicoverpa zea]
MGASQSEHTKSEKAELVRKIKERLASVDPDKAKSLGGVFLFNIFKGTSVYCWTMDLDQLRVYEGEPDQDPDTTVTMSEHYFKQMVTGREDPKVILQAGRCSVTGNVMKAMQLEPYIRLD